MSEAQSAPTIWVVMKFGGTSVSSAKLWREIADQVKVNQAAGKRVLIVVSAIRGITDALQQFVEAPEGQSAEAVLRDIRGRHVSLWEDLGGALTRREEQLLDELRGLLVQSPGKLAEPAVQARILAMGELLASAAGEQILNDFGLEARWQDARRLLSSQQAPGANRRSRYLSVRCRHQPDERLAVELAGQGGVHITQGFIASNEQGETVLLGRGGSDTSACYLAACLAAERVEIWTDVPGMFSANPRIIPGARLLKNLSYREAQELASMGARVLHPRCIEPVRAYRIPLHIRQTSRTEVEGTVISTHARDFAAQVKAICHRTNITLISMEGMRMWQQVGFLADAFEVFKRHGLSIDLVSTSESNVTVSLDMDEHLLEESVLRQVASELEPLCHVRIIHHCASVSLVGLGIRTILHRLGPALEVFEQRRIYLVSQAANDLNLTFVIAERHAERLVQQLHQILIPGGVGGDSVFGRTWEQLFYDRDPGAGRPEPWWRRHREALLEQFSERGAAYFYDIDTVRAAARRLKALTAVDRVLYATKANAHPAILRAAADEGLGIECVSIEEVRHVKASVPDIDPAEILFTPNFAPRSDYLAGLAEGVQLTVDNLFVLERWGEDLAGQEIFLRLDPGSGLGHHKMVRTAGPRSKFGIPPVDLQRVIALVERHRIHVTGLHAHTGSGIMHSGAWERTLAVLADFLPRLPDVRVIDVGGGLGVPDKSDELPLDLQAVNEGLARVRSALGRQVAIWLEPGRYLVSEAGVLMARVTQTKGKGEVRYVGLATGMNSLIRPTLYGAYHEIYNLTRLGEPPAAVFNVVGPICETGDVLGMDRLLPACQEGDVLLVANAGAYGAVMSSRYNLREPAEEVIFESQ